MQNCYYEAFHYIPRGLFHCVKSIRIRSFSGTYFPAFGLNTGTYSISLRIPSECAKIGTRNTELQNLNTDTEIQKLFTQYLGSHKASMT